MNAKPNALELAIANCSERIETERQRGESASQALERHRAELDVAINAYAQWGSGENAAKVEKAKQDIARAELDIEASKRRLAPLEAELEKLTRAASDPAITKAFAKTTDEAFSKAIAKDLDELVRLRAEVERVGASITARQRAHGEACQAASALLAERGITLEVKPSRTFPALPAMGITLRLEKAGIDPETAAQVGGWIAATPRSHFVRLGQLTSSEWLEFAKAGA